MPGIGPELPPHLQNRTQNVGDDSDSGHDDDSDGSGAKEIGPSFPKPRGVHSAAAAAAIGPQLPPHLTGGLSSTSPNNEEEDEDEDDDYGPALPPSLASERTSASKVASTSAPVASAPPRRVLGPSLPGHDRYGGGDDCDDDDFGPMPPPAHPGPSSHDGMSEGVRQFLEREERMQKAKEEAEKPKKLQREAWMLAPPSSSDLLGKLADPLKIKARQFSATSVSARSEPSSLWTETPQERMQRIADEVSGVKRRAVNATEEDKEDHRVAKRRKEAEKEVQKAVDNYNKTSRSKTLLEMHSSKSKATGGDEDGPPVIWDHTRDMSVGGRLMDDKDRSKLITDAKALDSRFGRGKSSFL